jgi:hypothetical protein
MKGYGRHIKETDEGSGENMLAGMLLHVIAPTLGVDEATNACPALGQFVCLDIVHDPAVFCLDHVCYPQPIFFRITGWG